MITLQSKVKQAFAHPIGHDVIAKLLLQMGKSEGLVKNPIVGNLRLKTVARLARKQLDIGFFQTLIDLLNSEADTPKPYGGGEIARKWWKEAVFYQIYPRSFNDANGDGIGDIGGIIEKLDYLQDLGIDAIWLSPVYDSPNDDNGYDIRDYFAILAEYGTMEDFDRLLEELRRRGMRLIMDLVVNHTSDEHKWFQEALADPNSKYRDYYIFAKSPKGTPPNNWTSFFSGSAWNYYEEQDIWALHLFSKKQMDLNWENEELRREIAAMVRWWHEKGVDGFRLDVINYISKARGLPPGHPTIGALMGYYGIEHYFYGPRLHEYLRELRSTAFAPYDAFSVGETPGVGMEMAKLLTADYREELDMIFSFDHLENPGKTRFDDYRYDLNYLKAYLIKWTQNYVGHSWMSLYFENHDNPRMVSKINPDAAMHRPLAKLLAVIQLTAQATPFIFQGQEMAAANHNFTHIDQLRDVESIGLYNELAPQIGEAAAFARVIAGSRGHARMPMVWEHGADAESVRDFYKAMIALRKQNPALVYGKTEFAHTKTGDYFAYYRRLDGDVFFVECNLCEAPKGKSRAKAGYQLLLSNYDNDARAFAPYEARVYRVLQ
ncbi:MAG: alpha-glucosidase [Clostridiales bacterium]|jgi:oligo-1,6-glucosidase|nr:alpha-glucosidase [Clostridiales bacterium]